MNHRVVITGLGCATPLGLGVEASWDALVTGRSGIEAIDDPSLEAAPIRAAGLVKGLDPLRYVRSRKRLKYMSREVVLGVAAARMALEDAGLTGADGTGLYVGCGLPPFRASAFWEAVRSSVDDRGEFSLTRFAGEGRHRIDPMLATRIFPNLVLSFVSINEGITGENLILSGFSSEGAQAVGEAFLAVREGRADAVLAGASDARVTPEGIAYLVRRGILSTSNGEARTLSRPFDRQRDGAVLSEGAGFLVLESLDHARARGAPIRAEVLGYGTAPCIEAQAGALDEPGPAPALSRALERAGVSPREVDYLNPEGASCRDEDAREARGIHAAFGERVGEIPVGATKSMTGHMMAASGAVEAIFTALALEHGTIPPTINQEHPDPECGLNTGPGQARGADLRVAVTTNNSLGEIDTALVLGKYAD